jgi:hypothetical protein
MENLSNCGSAAEKHDKNRAQLSISISKNKKHSLKCDLSHQSRIINLIEQISITATHQQNYG